MRVYPNFFPCRLAVVFLCFVFGLCVTTIANEGIFDNKLKLDDANFASFTLTSTSTGHQFQISDDFVLPAGSTWMVDGVRFTGALYNNGAIQPTIDATLTFNILILADAGGRPSGRPDDSGRPTGTPVDPIPGTAIALRKATATGTDTGIFTSAADFQLSFDPIQLEGGTAYWLVVAPVGDFTFQEILNPNGSSFGWIGRSGFGNAWQGGTDFQNNWIDQRRQQDFSLYGTPVTKRVPSYSLLDLGDLPGGDDRSLAYDINNNGQVVGSSAATNGFRGFIWDPVNGMQDLGDLPGGLDESYAYAINDQGKVIGDSEDDVERRPFLWDSVNGIQELVDFPEYSFAADINNLGQIIGNDGPNGAFVWDSANGIQDIFGFNDEYAFVSSINNHGQIVGQSHTGINEHGFFWDPTNGIMDIGDFVGGNGWSNAVNLNDLGEVIGGSQLTTTNNSRAVLWDSLNGLRNLGDLPGGLTKSFAYGINNLGQSVGRSQTAAQSSPYLWDAANGMQDLNHLIDESGCGWDLGYAWAINDLGQIVGCGINPDGFERGYLLTPIFEPDPLVISESFTVTRGTYVSGGLIDLAESDNADLSLQRATADIQSRTEIEAKAVSPVANPSSLEVTLEGAVFARSTVNQTIEIYDYVAAAWEQVDTRPATRFTDSTVTVAATGDLSRFVEAGTMCMKARIRNQSPVARQQFSSNTDQFTWTIGQ